MLRIKPNMITRDNLPKIKFSLTEYLKLKKYSRNPTYNNPNTKCCSYHRTSQYYTFHFQIAFSSHSYSETLKPFHHCHPISPFPYPYIIKDRYPLVTDPCEGNFVLRSLSTLDDLSHQRGNKLDVPNRRPRHLLNINERKEEENSSNREDESEKTELQAIP
ncbi:hypothetical protein NPIL_81541 [Nephila pilipes]|uniref:Uncharacterized protein n=1 Tax=Nephila pilipes TaxID=299642 RepID=A0A8X6N3L3_NEPPI|nr:hypothetical protein NPIL_81541 [Nephila pilipes]